ncbi:MAG: TonB-dependent receptor [Bergeyella sp.]|nr:TonB-dependent receptor [Bergeyella sp.]
MNTQFFKYFSCILSVLIFSETAAQNSTDSLKTIDIIIDVEAVKLRAYAPMFNEKISTPHTNLLTHDAGKFLTLLPEISGIKKSGNYSTDPVLRGFKYEQLNITTDGVSTAINACPGRMDPAISQINLTTLKEVEISKGPYFFRNGIGIGGNINFVSMPPHFSRKTKIKNQFSSAYETNGTIFRNELLSQISAKKWALDVSGSYQNANRYKDGDQNFVRSKFMRYSLNTNGAYKWSESQLTILKLTTNQGRNAEFAALKMDMLFDKTWMFQLGHTAEINAKYLKKLHFNSFYSKVSHSMATPDRSMITDAESATYGAKLESQWKWNKKVVYSGLDYRHYEARNTKIRTIHKMKRDGTAWQDAMIDQIGWYNEYTHPFERSKLFFSYRLDFNFSNAQKPSNLFTELYGNPKNFQINFSLSAIYKTSLSQSAHLSLLAGRSQRSGSLTERYINRFTSGLDNYEILGNPNLKPEKNNQIDIIYTFQKENWYLQTDVFFSYMENYISGIVRKDIKPYAMTAPGVRQIQNVGNAVKTGVETRIHWKFLPQNKTELSLAYTYAENINTKTPLAEIAPLQLSWIVETELSKWYIGGRYRYSAKQNRIDPNFAEIKTPGFSVIDFYTGYPILKNCKLSMEISNLFNTSYSEHLSRTLSTNQKQRIKERGRSFNVEIKLIF